VPLARVCKTTTQRERAREREGEREAVNYIKEAAEIKITDNRVE